MNDNYTKMTTLPVEKLVCRMAVPSILSMLITAFYNMADTYFVSSISTQATGAIGIVFSYMALIQAISFFFGHGAGNYISRELGRQNIDNATVMASTGFFTAIFTGAAIGIAGTVFIRPLLLFLGSTGTILPDAVNYIRFILIATPFIMGAFVLNNLMRMQGNAKLAVIGISSGAILNVVLDPVFIFVFGLGTMGAGLATAISQMVSFVLLLILSQKNGGVSIRWSRFKLTGRRFLDIFAGGIPSLARQGLGSVASIFLNNIVAPYSDSAIAAFSVVSKIFMMASSALIGFGQGFQPVCGFNYGARLFDRVKKAFRFCVIVATIAMTALAVFGYFRAESIVSIFRNDDPLLISIACSAIKYQCISMPLTGYVIITNMFLQNTRKTLRATVMAMARQGIMYIPVLLIMNYFLQLKGVMMSQAIADVLSFILAIPLSVSALKEMK